jgi:DNA-binding IclR family transcriptional regulator
MSRKSQYLIPMLERALRVLEALSEAADGLSLAELSQQLDAPKSSIFNILATLEESGYIRVVDASGKYTLTTKLFRVGSPAVARLNLKQSLHPLLAELVELTGETANLGILEGNEAVYIETIEGQNRLRVAVMPGERIDLHSTALGKMLLAHLPPERAVELLRSRSLYGRTPHTLTEPSALLEQFSEIRARGYALDDEEDHLEIRCLSAPVRDHTGRVVAAVSITAPKNRLTDEALERKAAVVTRVAARMSATLGYERGRAGQVALEEAV